MFIGFVADEGLSDIFSYSVLTITHSNIKKSKLLSSP